MLTATTARNEATGRNEGRTAASRLTVLGAELSGRGPLDGVVGDAGIIAHRAAAFARELGAGGEVGRVLAGRAAVLSVRADGLAQHNLIVARAAERRAIAAFDADRVGAIEELLAEADAPTIDPAAALATLAGCPDGLAALLRVWRGLGERLRGDEVGAASQAARWLGMAGAEGDREALHRQVDAEVARLARMAGTMDGAMRAVEEARAEAGRAARFNPGPDAAPLRRYEAAAERGMLQAIRLILTINRETGREANGAGMGAGHAGGGLRAGLGSFGAGMEPPRPPAPPSRPTPAAGDRREPLGSFRPGIEEELASFRVGIAPGAAGGRDGRKAEREGRSRRPDVRKVAGGRR